MPRSIEITSPASETDSVRGIEWRRGLTDTLKGYLGMTVGGGVGALFLKFAGKSPLAGEATYLPSGVLVSYWTTLTSTSLMVSIAAAIAGVFVIVANRSILTAGVMIVLALVPAATITGMAIALGEWGLALDGAFRLGLESVIILICSTLVFLWRRRWMGRGTLLTYPPPRQ